MNDVLHISVPFQLLTLPIGEVFLSRFKGLLPKGSGRRSPP